MKLNNYNTTFIHNWNIESHKEEFLGEKIPMKMLQTYFQCYWFVVLYNCQIHAIACLQVQKNPEGKHYNYKIIVKGDLKGYTSFLFHTMYVEQKLSVTDDKHGFPAHLHSFYQRSSILLHEF